VPKPFPLPVVAVVPVKDVGQAKQRLSPVLCAEERRRLLLAMLEDVLAALAATTELAAIACVTRDPEARALAGRFAARILAEAENRGQSAAVMRAAAALGRDGICAMLAVPADLPLVTPAAIGAVIEAMRERSAIVLAPSRDGLGTNVVACTPPGRLAVAFGDGSFARHLAGARAAGIDPWVVRRVELGLDIDTADDLQVLLSQPPNTRAHAYLRESGIAERLVIRDS